MSETWIDINCPACRLLGYPFARHLMSVHSNNEIIPTPEQHIVIKCWRCKSRLKWTFGMKLPEVLILGHSYKHKDHHSIFE